MASPWPSPAYRVVTPRAVVRCYAPDDVDPVHDAILRAGADLGRYMPWAAAEPRTRAERVETLRKFRGAFDLGTDFSYGVFDGASGEFVGGTGLHDRGTPGVLEIGYWLMPERRGQGLITEVAAALTQVGFTRMGAARLEIRVEPTNGASRAVPLRLGYREEGTLRAVVPGCLGRTRDDLIVYAMLADELPSSRANDLSVRMEGFA